MAISRNTHVSDRGNHSERVKTHNSYLAATYPEMFGHLAGFAAEPPLTKKQRQKALRAYFTSQGIPFAQVSNG